MFKFLFKPRWQHKDPDIRAEAVRDLNDPAMFQSFPEMLRNDPSEKVRLAVFERWGERAPLVETLRGASGALKERAQHRLMKRWLEQRQASELEALALIDDAEVLERLACEAPDPQLRRTLLTRIDRPGLLVERCLADPDAAIRLSLVERIEPGAGLKRVIEQARTRDKRVYRAALARMESAQLAQGSASAVLDQAQALVRRAETLLRALPEDIENQLAEISARWQGLASRVEPSDPEFAALQARYHGLSDTLQRAIAAMRAGPQAEAAYEAAQPTRTDGDTEQTPDAGDTSSVPASAQALEPDPSLLDWLSTLEAVEQADEHYLERSRAAFEQCYSALAANPENQRVRARFLDLLNQRRAELRQASEQLRQSQEQFRLSLNHWQQALDEGQVVRASALHTETEALLGTLRNSLKPEDVRRHAQLKQRQSKLADLRRWSTNQARAELCQEAEALPGLGLHPDALAHKVKELRDAWAKLDASEGLSPEAAKQHGLSRRFRALIFAAMKPAKQFFEKRDAVRERHTGDVQSLLTAVQALIDAESIDPTVLQARRGDLAQALRDLDRGDPTQRKILGERIRAMLDQCKLRLDTHNLSIRGEKEKLIAQLRLKVRNAARGDAIELVKAAQARFRTMPRSDRASEQRLFDELRAIADPLFDAMKAERAQNEAADTAQRQAQEAVLAEVQALVGEAAHHPGATLLKLEQLSQQWRAFDAESNDALAERTDARRGSSGDRRERGGRSQGGSDDRRGERNSANRASERSRAIDPQLERAFGKAQQAVEQAVSQAQAEARARAMEVLHAKHLFCAGLEARRLQGETLSMASFEGDFNALGGAEGSESDAPMRRRFERIFGAEPEALGELEARSETAHALALTIELLDERPSPAAFEDARKALQMQRLAARLSGAALAPEQERRSALQSWYTLGAVLPSVHQDIESRIHPKAGVDAP